MGKTFQQYRVETSAFSAREKMTSFKAWELKRGQSAFAPEGVWTNQDMEPVPPVLWTWGVGTFIAYWISDLISPASWSQVSSFIALGLTWWESIIATFVGGFLLSIVVVFNGIIGAKIHTPFAVSSRAPFGYHFSKFPVISRMVIAWFWFSTNTYQGGTGIKLCLISIWPSFRHFPNHLPESSGTTSQDMLCFFIFWLIQFPFCLIHPSRLRIIFMIKALTVPLAAVGMMAWAIHAAGDQAPVVMRASSTLHGREGYWAFMTAVNSCIATWSTLACNIGDFARYSKKPTNAIAQIGIIPVLWTLCALFGAITSNMTSVIYGELLFQPFDIIEKWLDNRTGRVAAFFCSLTWAIANMATNITANSISSANDLCTLFPRWINIFRGQLFAMIVGIWAFAPWKVLASAADFLNFMASYAIILSPIAAILCSDYYLVRYGKIDVPQLYDPRGIYYYDCGVNWRAVFALICAITPNLPGMIHSLNTKVNIGDLRFLYAVANIFGMVTAASVYAGLSKLFPPTSSLVVEAVYAHEILVDQDNADVETIASEEKDKGGRIYVKTSATV